MIQSMGKIISGVGLLTLLLLVYVHEQVALVRVSYLIDSKSAALSRMSEEYRQLKFDVDQLKAPRLLEEKMKTLSLDLALPQEIHVVRTPALPLPAPGRDVPTVGSISGNMFHFLGHWVEVAQAKTDNETN